MGFFWSLVAGEDQALEKLKLKKIAAPPSFLLSFLPTHGLVFSYFFRKTCFILSPFSQCVKWRRQKRWEAMEARPEIEMGQKWRWSRGAKINEGLRKEEKSKSWIKALTNILWTPLQTKILHDLFVIYKNSLEIAILINTFVNYYSTIPPGRPWLKIPGKKFKIVAHLPSLTLN